jgi:hypothetical protein
VEDYDDTKLTHPNIKSRRQAMIAKVTDMNDEGRKNFVQSESTFNELQKMCRFENCLIDLGHTEFPGAFYNSFCFSKMTPQIFS